MYRIYEMHYINIKFSINVSIHIQLCNLLLWHLAHIVLCPLKLDSYKVQILNSPGIHHWPLPPSPPTRDYNALQMTQRLGGKWRGKINFFFLLEPVNQVINWESQFCFLGARKPPLTLMPFTRRANLASLSNALLYFPVQLPPTLQHCTEPKNSKWSEINCVLS